MTTHSICHTNPTADKKAQEINSLLNSVNRMAEAGRLIQEKLDEFDGDYTRLNRWMARNLDCAAQSGHRYRHLAEHLVMLEAAGIYRLVDAYRVLEIDGNISTKH